MIKKKIMQFIKSIKLKLVSLLFYIFPKKIKLLISLSDYF